MCLNYLKKICSVKVLNKIYKITCFERICCLVECCVKNEDYGGVSIDDEWNEIFNEIKSDEL